MADSSFVGRITDAYSMLWKMIIRPPRDVYSLEELGPAKFRLGKRVYERKDLQLKSPRGFMLECSHFIPSKAPTAKRPCVVYLHGNCSSRLEAFDALPVLLPRDLTVFCLDLAGSGRSEGEYISLGHHEEKDLLVVLEHLRATNEVTSIGLWGRSMGAVTSILRAGDDLGLAACVLDSPFGDLKTVAEELVNRGRFKVPQFIVNMGIELIRNEVCTRAGFDVNELIPIKCAPRAQCPALFGVASDDTFVLPHHTQDLHNAWAGERVLRVFDGGHNGVRPAWFLEEASDFLAERLGKAAGTKAKTLRRVGAVSPTEDIPLDDDDGMACASTPRTGPKTNSTKARPQISLDGPARSIDKPEKKESLTSELKHMGFGEEASAEAAKHSPNVEGAVAWLLKNSSEALSNVDMRPAGHRTLNSAVTAHDGESAALDLLRTTTMDNLGSLDNPIETNRQVKPLLVAAPVPARDVAPAVDKANPSAKRSVEPPGTSLMEQLQYLGFEQAQCESAARQCLSVEAAVEWLSSQRATVQL